MWHIEDQIRDALGRPPNHEWCDTTRLAEQFADPWSIILGRTMRPPRRTTDGCDMHTPRRDAPSGRISGRR
jgi:hypothetical protein